MNGIWQLNGSLKVGKTKISWADYTFNPWEGCQKVSPGCDNCYAEARNQRFHKGVNWGPGAPRRVTSKSNWLQPKKWEREAHQAGVRHRVFCGSLCDVFDNKAPILTREDLWNLIKPTRANLDWLLLTKRPQNIEKMLPQGWGVRGWPHVWLGTTIENREELARRAPDPGEDSGQDSLLVM